MMKVPSVGGGYTNTPITSSAANPVSTLNQGIEFSTGAFSVGTGSSATQGALAGGINPVVIILAAVAVGGAFLLRGRK